MMDQDSERTLTVLARDLWAGVVVMLPLRPRTCRGPRRGSRQPPGLPGEDLRSRLSALPAQERSELRRLVAPRCCWFPSLGGGHREPFGPPTLAPSVATGPSPTLQHGYRTLGNPPRVDATAPGEHPRTIAIPLPAPPPCLPAWLRSGALPDSLPQRDH